MWREVGRSAATGGQRVPRSHVSSAGPPPNWSFKLRCCRNRVMSVHSRGSLVSRWQNWIRAWGRGEPVTSHSAARTVECAALACSRVDWTSQVRGPLHPGFSRFRGRMTAASTRRHALGRMAVSRLKMMHFSLCKIAQSEPSRGRAGTWRRQVQSKAAPRCRRVRVQHESTRIRIGEQWQGRTCRPRATRCGDGPASQARHHGRPASSSVRTRNSAKRRTALSNQAHNMAQRPGEQGPQRDARAPQGVSESSGAGGMKKNR